MPVVVVVALVAVVVVAAIDLLVLLLLWMTTTGAAVRPRVTTLRTRAVLDQQSMSRHTKVQGGACDFFGYKIQDTGTTIFICRHLHFCLFTQCCASFDTAKERLQ
jgi:hypothetical protein